VKKFIEELKRRNVIKASLAYLVVSWIIVQVAQAVLPTFGAPDWVLKTLIIGLAIGLPIWIIISWIYDITPEGIEKTAKDSGSELVTQATNKRLNVFIIVSLSIAVIVMGLKLSNVFTDSDYQKSIAVLPFENMSGDPDQETMCDGLTEEIIHHLSTISLFDKVISRGSVMTFKDSEKTTHEIASMLDVNFILEGSYRQSGNRLRISSQLIEASSDKSLWSEIYERPIGDIFDIQSDIAKNIAFNLKGKLSSIESIQFNKARTENIKAFELYQLGRFYWNQRTGEGYQRSIEYFQQAIDEDPEYGLAYAGLADTYNLMALQGHIDQNEGRDKAVDLSKKALELDDQLAEAHNVLASIYTYIDKDWKSAEREYLKAIEINPNYPTVHHYYSEYLSFMGNHEEARKQVNKAIELDPLSFVIRYVSVKTNFNQGQFQEALLDLERCKELNHGKDHPWIADMDFRINRELGNEQAAFDGIKRSYGFWNIMEPKEMDSIYQVSGIDGILKKRIESTDNLSVIPSLYGILGNDEKALEWLEIGVENGEYHAEFPFMYEFRNLHSDPRFQALLRKIGLGD
jgi:TolB-like protein